MVKNEKSRHGDAEKQTLQLMNTDDTDQEKIAKLPELPGSPTLIQRSACFALPSLLRLLFTLSAFEPRQGFDFLRVSVAPW
jgi:hypothetical protein